MHMFDPGVKRQTMCPPQDASFLVCLVSCFGSVCVEWRVRLESIRNHECPFFDPCVFRFLNTSRGLPFEFS